MSKAVMLSIQPKWCELTANGKKTIEVRKTRSKLETPFKCYIYCTASDVHSGLVVGGGTASLIRCCNYKTGIPIGGAIGNGKVIGEFVCDKIEIFDYRLYAYSMSIEDLIRTQIGVEGLNEYGGGKTLYGWHISDLKIYDTPKELGEFRKQNSCHRQGDLDTIGCWEGVCTLHDLGKCDGRCSPLTRPPQSWCYVEAQGE